MSSLTDAKKPHAAEAVSHHLSDSALYAPGPSLGDAHRSHQRLGEDLLAAPSTARLTDDSTSSGDPLHDGGSLGHEMPRGALPGSLTSWLWSREQVARCSAALAISLHIGIDEVEVLLLSEAHKRRVPVGALAQEARGRGSSAARWRPARCSVCQAAGVLQISGRFQLDRVVVCPAGHGVLC